MSVVADDAAAERTVVLFGNPVPQMQVPVLDPETGLVTGQRSERARHVQQSVTRVEMWPGFDDPEFVDLSLSTDNDRVLSMIGERLADEHRNYAVGVNEFEQVLAAHSAGHKPAWVWSSDPAFARALGAHLNCPVAEREPEMLLTNAGRDAIHSQHTTTGAQPAAFNYLALSADTATELATNTALPGEITTAGGGLVRAQATVAHTAGTNTTTLTKTFTANGSDALPVVVAKAGVLNAAAAGTLAYERKLTTTAPLSVVGDNVALTDTLTIG